MKSMSVTEAFGAAPPRSAAVLCVAGPNGSSDLILTDWFTWLNIKRQPMISFSMPRNASLGLDIQNGDRLVLAFPPLETAKKYRQGVRTAAQGQEKMLPEGVHLCALKDSPILIPAESETALQCTLENAYNFFPFKKVRIFNCNLEEALAAETASPARE